MNHAGVVWDRMVWGWVEWMYPMAWQVAVLAAIVWGLTRLVRKSSASFRHALWLLVFVKLVLPPTLATPWSVGTLANRFPETSLPLDIAEISEPSQTPIVPITTGWHDQARSIVPPEPNAQPIAPPVFSEDRWSESSPPMSMQPSSPLPESSSSPPEAFRVTFTMLAMALWALVAAGMFGFFVFQGLRHHRAVMRDLSPMDADLAEIVRQQAEGLRVKQRFAVRLSPHIRIPAVVGFVRPTVLLPMPLVSELSSEQLANLIGHELAHIRRRDVLQGAVSMLLLCLYWFHPAVWLANFHLRREREMACDDAVLYATRQEGRKYASTIIRVAESFDETVPAGAGFLGLLEISENLLQRIRSAADATRSRRFGRRSLAALAALALLLIPMGVWTAASSAEEAPSAALEAEIAKYYDTAEPEFLKFVRVEGARLEQKGLWPALDAFAGLSGAEREAKVAETLKVLDGPPGDEQAKAVTEAGALKDPRLLPALINVAWSPRSDGAATHCRHLAAIALGRLDDRKAVPILIPLLGHINEEVNLWSFASLTRLTGQYFREKDAWIQWANSAGPDTAISPAILEWVSSRFKYVELPKTSAALGEAAPAPSPATPSIDPAAAVEQEITDHYAVADPDVQEYIRWTARTFSRGGLWFPANAFENLSPEERERKIQYDAQVLEGEYGRHLCTALAEAGALKDKRLLPGLIKAASFHREDSDYDCRPKWMAVSALGRQDDVSAVPTIVPLVDHGNQNTRMWARASLVRLTGQNFSADKQAWGKWWNESCHEPKIDLAQLKPWVPLEQRQATAAPGATAAPAGPPAGTGPVGKVLRFDGQDDYIAIPPSSPLDLTKNLTVSAWAKVDPGLRGEAPLLRRGDDQPGFDPYVLGVYRNKMHFGMFLGREGRNHDAIPMATADYDSQWHYWTGVHDAEAGRLFLYKDAALANEVPVSGQIQYDTRNMGNEIGAIDRGKWGGSWGFFKGEIDQISVWNVARKPEEIQREVREGLKGDEPGLVALWTFDEDGQSITDLSPSKITATLGSTPEADSNDPARVPANEALAAAAVPSAAPQMPAAPAPLPPEVTAVIERLPGELVYTCTYQHRSRGGDLPQPATVWLKSTPQHECIAACYLPAFNTTYVTYATPGKDLHGYIEHMHGRDGRPPSKREMELNKGTVSIKYEGGEKDGQTETFTVPDNAIFCPNSRPDPYAAHMALFLASLAKETRELTCYDWDNTGKGFASYNIRLEYKGQETVTVPAGTFTAHHYVETHLTFGDTWYKKRPGHVTDYWCLDNGVIVHILRHREPYEILLTAAEGAEPLPGQLEARAESVASEPAVAGLSDGELRELVKANYQTCREYRDRSRRSEGYLQENAPKRLAYWQEAAKRGIPEAQTLLALCYHYGVGLTVDLAKKGELLQAASEQGDPVAMFNLAQAYITGSGRPRNVQEGMNWYQKAVELGDSGAMWHMAFYLVKGQEVPRDTVKAVELLRKSVELGNARAMVVLGDYYRAGDIVDKNETESAKLYQKAAELGYDEARQRVRQLDAAKPELSGSTSSVSQ
ncbi:MAG: SEL1-like repeat protein [Candidatus Hydrogenedentes bacterium]|nr:SEL1-like repeat protein [Candidatus Hydrogenedentota bacterium]